MSLVLHVFWWCYRMHAVELLVLRLWLRRVLRGWMRTARHSRLGMRVIHPMVCHVGVPIWNARRMCDLIERRTGPRYGIVIPRGGPRAHAGLWRALSVVSQRPVSDRRRCRGCMRHARKILRSLNMRHHCLRHFALDCALIYLLVIAAIRISFTSEVSGTFVFMRPSILLREVSTRRKVQEVRNARIDIDQWFH